MAAASIRTNWLCSTTVKHEERTEMRLIRCTFKVDRLWEENLAALPDEIPHGVMERWSIEGKEIPNHKSQDFRCHEKET